MSLQPKQMRTKIDSEILQELMEQEKDRSSMKSGSKEVEQGPPPPPPERSCSSGSKSELPPGPSECYF